MMKRSCIALGAALMLAATASAQFSYDGFQSAPHLWLDGASSIDANGVLQLTPAQPNLLGQAFDDRLQSFGGSFTSEFAMRMHGGTSDGLGLEIQTDGVPTTLLNSQRPRLYVFFDTYQNPQNASSNDIVIELHDGAGYIVQEYHPVAAPNFNDGALHTVRIAYDGPTKALDVFVDDMQNPKVTTSVDLVGDLPLQPGDEAWVGFFGWTGAGYQVHEVHSWSFWPGAEAIHLSVNGTCPGAATFEVMGGSGIYALVSGRPGTFTKPGPPCAGVVLDVSQPVLRAVISDSYTAQLPAAACGAIVQVVDVNTCEPSNTVVL